MHVLAVDALAKSDSPDLSCSPHLRGLWLVQEGKDYASLAKGL